MASTPQGLCLGLDKNQQKLFIEFLKSLPEKPTTTIRFFDCSDYYSIHGSDAHFVAKCISKIESIKSMDFSGRDRKEGDTELDYLSVSKATFPVVARDLLLVKKYRVEVYVKKGSRTEYVLSYKGSPGNLLQFEEVLFGNLDTMAGSSLLSVHLKAGSGGSSGGKQKHICLGFIDCLQQDLAVAEIVDDDNLTEFEAFVVLLAPKECLLPSKENEYLNIYKILTRNNILVTLRKKTDFQGESSAVIDDLNNLLKFKKGQQKNAYTLVGDSNDSALLSLGAAIKYLEISTDESCWGQFHIRHLDLKRFVQMDSSAITAFNILPGPDSNPNSSAYKYQSLLGVLDRCRTPQGHRLMAQWVVQPLRNVDMINDRHNIVECLIDATHVRTLLHDDYLKRFPDIMVLCKKLMRKRAALQDIYRLYQVVVRTQKVENVLQDLGNVTVETNLCAPLKDLQEEFAKFKKMVDQILDTEAVDRNEYLIQSDFDEGLRTIKEEMTSAEDDMNNLAKRINEDLGLESGSVKLDYTNQEGYFFKMTRKNDDVLRKNKSYKVLQTHKSGVKFTNTKLGDLNEKFKEAQSTYQTKQQEIVDEIIQVAQGYVDSFATLATVVAELDCLVSFAIVAVSAPVPYVRPSINDGSGGRKITLKDLRHPFIELQDDMNFIANAVDFQEEESRMYVITGPNMGGKSTYIRSVGCAVAMALMGCFVPCSAAEISVVDRIYGRVGACDDIGKGLSTFMKEMVETAGILRNATKDSLVIIDELGRGTSTYEGCGLAWAIAEHLATETKSFTLFATHFLEITALARAEAANGVKNYYMAAHADDGAFTLLYQLKPGVTDKSFGIHVAKLVKFPEATVAFAEETYQKIADHFSEIRNDADREKFLEVTKEFESVDLESDAALERMIEEVQGNVKGGRVDKSFEETLKKMGIRL